MVLAMHAGFAFLELGTVRKKNQVNALVKILVDFSVSTIAYFFIGYTIAYGVQFFGGAESLAAQNGYALVRFFFLLTFAAAIPAIVSGGIAERSKFNPQLFATFVIVGFVYPLLEGVAWNERLGVQNWLSRDVRCPVPRFRRLGRRSCVRRLDRAARRVAARRAPRPLSQGRAHRRASAVEYSVSRARRVGARGRLVRLQRDERANGRQDQRARRRQLADGDGRRHAGRAGSRDATTRASLITGRSRGWSRFARART